MKKFFCCLLAAMLILGTFAGCKKQDTPPAESTGAKQTETTGTAQTESMQAVQTENSKQTENEEIPVDPTEQETEKKKAFQVVIVHKDGTTKKLPLETEAEYLGAALIKAGVVEAEENRFGMHIKVADGERAVFKEDGAYWAVYVGEEFAAKSTDLTPVETGATYRLVYSTPVLEDPDEPTWYVLNHLVMPIARGQVGTDWDTVSEFWKAHGYPTKIDEGTYGIRDPFRAGCAFGGTLTNANGYAELCDLSYDYWEGNDVVASAGVIGRSAKRENPAYGININPYYGTFRNVDSLAEVEAYIRSNG